MTGYVAELGPEGYLPHALAYAEARWAVFPLAPRSKVPLISAAEGGHGHLDGTTDVEQVRRWWERHPLANIGTRVPDGQVVIDVDPRHGGFESLEALERRLGPLDPTLTSWTGSGGVHLFYGHPGGELRQAAHKLGPGVDVKVGGKGYVVLPPSMHPNGRLYQWCPTMRSVCPLPEALAALLRPPAPPAMPRQRVVAVPGAYGRAALEVEAAAVRAALRGTRNDTLNRASFALGQLVAGGELPLRETVEALFDAGRAAGLGDVECEKTITSGMKAGMAVPRGARP
ncbi:MAG: bifunctional DNA primase/polymerase [Actinomycetota bacterium]|nr:bifunctional DNA primase/polymerase [Actinomycetota bacterium]